MSQRASDARHRGPATIAPLDETLIARPSIHRVTFETNRATGEWRARCSCGWSDTQLNKDEIDAVAARHDLEEIAPRAVKRPRQGFDFGEALRGFVEQQLKFREYERKSNNDGSKR